MGYTNIKCPQQKFAKYLTMLGLQLEKFLIQNINYKIWQAGRSRWKGIRPTVRGSVMNQLIIHMEVEKVDKDEEPEELKHGVNQQVRDRRPELKEIFKYVDSC